MPSSEELQLAFDLHVDRNKVAEKEGNLQERVSQLQAELDRDKWDSLAHYLHAINVDKGFWGDPVEMDKWVAKLMLVVTEVAEVTEALRKSQGPDKVTEEFADVFIRLLDIYSVLVDAGEADPHLYGILHEKTETNKNRAPKHGNRWG